MFKVNSIASTAYRTSITDGRFLKLYIERKRYPNVKTLPSRLRKKLENESHSSSGERLSKRASNDCRKAESIWKGSIPYHDTSRMYRRNRCHMGLWSRIKRNSNQSLPREIRFAEPNEIIAEDRVQITSYTTPSRGCRKCCVAVFSKCALLAATDFGCFENSQKRPYRVKPISLSVKELSKNTNAGTDTLGRKDDPDVQNVVIQQLRDLFRRPTSFKLFDKNYSYAVSDKLFRMFDLPELIFHRFQATYDRVTGICKEKSRIVWCVPYTIVALENLFFGKIIESCKDRMRSINEVVYPTGLTNYQIGQRSVGTLRSKYANLYYHGAKDMMIVSIDISKFDSSMVNWFKDIFFAMFEPAIHFVGSSKKVYDYLRLYVKFTPFVYEGKVLHKLRGISSGLLITNFIDSLWNYTTYQFQNLIELYYPEYEQMLFEGKFDVEKTYIDPSRVIDKVVLVRPTVRVFGDDSIFLCTQRQLTVYTNICKMLGMTVKVKHCCNHPEDPIFFLGRYWNNQNRPFQTDEYLALRIVYTKWYNEKDLPFSIKKLHLYRMLSICLPFVNGKEFLDKYLYDYPGYQEFINSGEGYVFCKEYITDQYQYYEGYKVYDVDSY